jgi:hypothetical protein
MPNDAIRAVRGLLDFIYLARYPSHDDTTLGYMKDALDVWRKNREVFVRLGIHKDFIIPKFHSLLHYIDTIRLFGTTDNYNSELFERLHIDFAKDGWRHSNGRDAFPQMIKWVERHEKVAAFQSYLRMRSPQATQELHPLKSVTGLSVTIPKHPSAPQFPVKRIAKDHNCPSFQRTLKEYILSLGSKPHGAKTVKDFRLPFQTFSTVLNSNPFLCMRMT